MSGLLIKSDEDPGLATVNNLYLETPKRPVECTPNRNRLCYILLRLLLAYNMTNDGVAVHRIREIGCNNGDFC